MAPSDYKVEKLSKNEARKQIRKVFAEFKGEIIISRHAIHELEKDDLSSQDALNVLKSPDSKIIDESEFENGSYRYRVETNNIVVVVAFVPDGKAIIV